MITHLHGKLHQKTPTTVVVDVAGVGYRVATSLITSESLAAVGEEVFLYTYQHVREDVLELFGFADNGEREVFQLLISVSGIGPTSAQTILSGMSVRDLQRAVLGERVGELTAIKGIGRKTAQRMVVELRDRIGAPMSGNGNAVHEGRSRAIVEEAVGAMVALGMGTTAARQAVERASSRHDSDTVEELIKRALRER